MGSSRNKMLNQQETAARTQYQQSFQQAQAPTEAERIVMERNKAFLNWMDTPGKDITSAPGLAPYLQIGAAARERRQRQRMGTGGLALSGVGSEGYAAKLREQQMAEEAANFGTGLESAVAGRYAEATGSMLPLAQLGTQRSLGVLGSAQSNLQGYMNAPRETPFWKQLTMGAVQGAAGILGGMATGGTGFFKK